MNTFENEIINISSEELKVYADLIFELKIKEFVFYRYKNINKIDFQIRYSYQSDEYFSYCPSYYSGDINAIIEESKKPSRLTGSTDSKVNNIMEILNHPYLTGGNDREFKLYCPELVLTLKPAKRE